ncbi:PEBP-like protein [Punctularia strigosozonata HHB-11173 SS5]|uniref:PEBP-like protein n=1 Tax=Punctularia strigosozonata (strain HHB-11173) TaxID=741275 RepID=UPI00044179C4|nr:PEBP-like protein [Punctularia strigosozonata HHB-11173 SS5]EIN13222.1 PEBP-like protein [Punctularia strigosozonata HHB-11173 SS5]
MLAIRRLRTSTARLSATFASTAPAAEAQTSSAAPTQIPEPPSAPLVASISSKAAASLASPKPKEAENSPSTDATTATTTAGRRKYATRRPHISPQRPREWSRPLAPGVLPAYDEALRYIVWDSAVLTEEAQQLKKQISEKEEQLKMATDAEKETVQESINSLKEKANIVEVQSQINRPEVRWKFRNGLADMTQPVYRKLTDLKWRTEGDLDLLMERIHQMNVVPDVLPSLHPTIDVRVTFPEAPSPRNRTVRKAYKAVEPGVYLVPEQTRKPPHIYVSVMHPEERYYTLLLVDPDVPNETDGTYQTYLHWMITNIRLSSTTSLIETSRPYIPFPYVPPHPQKGTDYHRYTLLLLPHAEPDKRIDIKPPTNADADRQNFDVRGFMAEHGLDGSVGGGAHMWREVWNEEVSKIYQDVLKTDEPRYGYPPKADPYAEVKEMDKYGPAA